jgi:hypothetical protein
MLNLFRCGTGPGLTGAIGTRTSGLPLRLGTAISGDRWSDDVRLSDLEQRFTCQACGRRGADVRPDWQSAEEYA